MKYKLLALAVIAVAVSGCDTQQNTTQTSPPPAAVTPPPAPEPAAEPAAPEQTPPAVAEVEATPPAESTETPAMAMAEVAAEPMAEATPEPAPAPAPAPAAMSQDDALALAQTSGCLACHDVNKKLIGPSWKDVAIRYQGDANAQTTLIEKVKKGGAGSWADVTGGIPMPAYSPRVSDDNITALVDFILEL